MCVIVLDVEAPYTENDGRVDDTLTILSAFSGTFSNKISERAI